jgi:LPS export ABC transporter protein LptC
MAIIFCMKKFHFLILVMAWGCNQKENTQPKEYEGPLQQAENVELFYTEDRAIKVKMKAPVLYEFKTGDREFPKGLYLEFYDELGNLSSTLRANHAYYFKSEDKWRARGKVEVINKAKNEQLNTEELYWFPAKQEILSEKFVTIRQQQTVLYGEGLQAKQDMSVYSILKPQGEIEIEEEPSTTTQESQ